MGSTTKNGKSEMNKLYETDRNGKMGQIIWDGGVYFTKKTQNEIDFRVSLVIGYNCLLHFGF